MNKPTLYIIRGVSSSGKTTLARLLASVFVIYYYEADQYFTNTETGAYEFDPAKLKDAHDWCFDNVKRTLERNASVIVANTFTAKWELERYLALQDIADIRIFTLQRLPADAERFASENKHGVPADVIQKQLKRFEADITGKAA